jgi:ABC-type polysaccharide/polyol phosphate export permease
MASTPTAPSPGPQQPKTSRLAAPEARAGGLVAEIVSLIREQVDYRELLWAITRRDLALRYRNALIGLGWAVCAPLLHMLIFTVIFTRVVRLETDVPYPLFAFSGLVPWTLLASSLRVGATSLTVNPHLVTKVYFPREVLPFSTVLVSLIDFVVAFSLLIVLIVYYGFGLTAAALFLPVVLLVQLIFTAALTLLVAMATLFYADVKYLLELGITVWMLATSVVYPVERVGGGLGAVLALNPMTPIIDAYRTVLLAGELPPLRPFLAAAAVSVLALLASWLIFHRAEFRFAEEL